MYASPPPPPPPLQKKIWELAIFFLPRYFTPKLACVLFMPIHVGTCMIMSYLLILHHFSLTNAITGMHDSHTFKNNYRMVNCLFCVVIKVSPAGLGWSSFIVFCFLFACFASCNNNNTDIVTSYHIRALGRSGDDSRHPLPYLGEGVPDAGLQGIRPEDPHSRGSPAARPEHVPGEGAGQPSGTV